MTALRCLRVKPGKKGLNRRLRPVLRGGTSSHTLPNHVIGKRMVNTSLAKGHHAQTLCTASQFFLYVSHDSSMPNKNCTLLVLTGEDDIAKFDSWRYS